MIDDVVDHVGRRHHAKRLAHPAQRMLSQVGEAGALPLPTIPTLSSSQPFAPCVRVEHLHRLRAHLLGTSGLHGDAGLSHGDQPNRKPGTEHIDRMQSLVQERPCTERP